MDCNVFKQVEKPARWAVAMTPDLQLAGCVITLAQPYAGNVAFRYTDTGWQWESATDSWQDADTWGGGFSAVIERPEDVDLELNRVEVFVFTGGIVEDTDWKVIDDPVQRVMKKLNCSQLPNDPTVACFDVARLIGTPNPPNMVRLERAIAETEGIRHFTRAFEDGQLELVLTTDDGIEVATLEVGRALQ